MMITKTSLRATIISMEEETSIRIFLNERTYHTIRNTAYNVGKEMGRKYSVHLDRKSGSVEVMRKKDE